MTTATTDSPDSGPVSVLALIGQMAALLEAAGLTFSNGYGQGTTNAFD